LGFRLFGCFESRFTISQWDNALSLIPRYANRVDFHIANGYLDASRSTLKSKLIAVKSRLLLIPILVAGHMAFAQSLPFIKDHRYHVRALSTSKDSIYQQVLDRYDGYLRTHPNDVFTHVEKCKFINSAFFNVDEDYNPKYEEAEACAQDLVAKFPNEPEALLYATEFVYGDSATAYYQKLRAIMESNSEQWRGHNWIAHQKMAEQFSVDKNFLRAISFAKLASDENDTLDLSLLMGRAHKNLSNNQEAIEVLTSKLDSTNDAWDLNQKGKLLLELGATQEALKAFQLALKDSTGYHEMGDIAQAMIDNGLIQEARAYLVKENLRSSWNPSQSLQQLLEYDLAHSPADTAKHTYEQFVAEDFWNDGFGIYRLKLFVRGPWLGWTWSDVGRVLLLVLGFLAIFIFPYLWILPIHYFGMMQRAGGKILDEFSFRWGLRHFWIACSLWFVIDGLAFLMFDYRGVLSMIANNLTAQDLQPLNIVAANMMIFSVVACLIMTLAFFTWRDLIVYLSNLQLNLKPILQGIGLAILLRFGLGFYALILRFFGMSITDDPTSMASIVEIIASVNKFYGPWIGFVLVVIVVPFYEEVLFRGVFLSACARNMKFVVANILQSFVFAIAHQQPKLIPFYFVFGMVAGFVCRKSQSLTTGISMHATNNLTAFITMLVRMP
jgi:uncharacterized protein